MKLTFGGGASILDGKHGLNDPRVFKKFNLDGCSEERLLRVKRGESVQAAARTQNKQYSSLINSLKSANHHRYSKAHLPTNPMSDHMKTSNSTIMLPTATTSQIPSDLEAYISHPFASGLNEIQKLANLNNFFIVKINQQKYASVTKDLQESKVKESIQKGIDRFLRTMKTMKREESSKELSTDHQLVNKKSEVNRFMTISEKRMERLDGEIKRQIEEAIIVEKRKQRVEFYKPDPATQVKMRKRKIESKIKQIRKIDPEFLVNLKIKQKSPQKEEISNVAQNGRSVSTMNLSPSESRMSGGKREQSPWQEMLRRRLGDETKIVRKLSSDFSDYSSIAKEFVKDGNNMQRSLSSAFRTRVSINPQGLYKSINSYKSYN